MLDLEAAFGFVKEHLDGAMRSGSYSLGFALDLAMTVVQGRDNVFRTIDEVAILEGARPGPSRTKAAAPFTRRHLAGYWHKHHTQAGFMPQNLRLEMIKDDTVERVWKPHAGEVITQEHIDKLVHALVIGNYERRAGEGRLTGEWVVYALRDGANHYVTLASHDEGDELIAERLRRYEDIDAKTGWRYDRCSIVVSPPTPQEGGTAGNRPAVGPSAPA